ncbi:hypothetical protein [Burkholderia ubonensis]|uniref:hypothetical protein n=1 Tax=Burkholderia ubonensis TaxID=101571 RepID=UPI000A733C81|nr:hypothetical protein [Burkholderia ubonensis]
MSNASFGNYVIPISFHRDPIRQFIHLKAGSNHPCFPKILNRKNGNQLESIPDRFPDALLADAARISYADTHQTDAKRRPPAWKPAAACDSGDVPSCSRRRNKRPAFTHWDERCKTTDETKKHTEL